MPWDKSKYPANWDEIRAAILQRAGDRCEGCGVPNHERGARDCHGKWRSESYLEGLCSDMGDMLFPDGYPDIIRLVLTIAHLDHNPQNNDPDNLRAYCQLCHNRHDAAMRAEHRRQTRLKKIGQAFLPGMEG